jgi:hypothetical protein
MVVIRPRFHEVNGDNTMNAALLILLRIVLK